MQTTISHLQLNVFFVMKRNRANTWLRLIMHIKNRFTTNDCSGSYCFRHFDFVEIGFSFSWTNMTFSGFQIIIIIFHMLLSISWTPTIYRYYIPIIAMMKLCCVGMKNKNPTRKQHGSKPPHGWIFMKKIPSDIYAWFSTSIEWMCRIQVL